MSEAIALTLFISWMVFIIVWARRFVSYELTENCVIVRHFGFRKCKIPYEEIRHCEVLQATELWRPSRLLGSYRWWHSRRFVGGIIIHSTWGNFVLTPKNPQEFSRLLAERQQRSKDSQKH